MGKDEQGHATNLGKFFVKEKASNVPLEIFKSKLLL
jgi:hypothetical protein